MVAKSVVPQEYIDSAGQDESGRTENAACGHLGLDIHQCERFEHEAAAALACRGRRVLLLPHVYHLSSSHPAIARLAEAEGDIVMGSWLHPRPTYWALRAHGLEGEFGEPSSAMDNNRDANRGEKARTIHCFDLRCFGSAAECVERWQRLSGSPGASGAGHVEDLSQETPPRWYPILDYSRCASCKQCFEFCLFGVYSLVDGTVVATQPDNCKPGCPACARVCPKGAIMFPHHTADPGIAGAPGATISTKPMDVEAFFRSTAPHPSPPDSSAPCKCKKADRDDLDDLIDALDDME